MELFVLLFGDLLAFVYHCFDRIVIYGYLSGLSRPAQVVHFFRNVVGVTAVSKEVLSQLCSSPAVHNAMLERRPDLCAALYEDLWRSRFGEEDATNQSAYPLPVWGVRDGKFTSHYSRTYVEAAQRRPESEVPRVNDKQWQALDLLATLAEELCFEMSFAPGDIQFVNNHVIYHARSAFEDDDEGHDRLLLRLWLSMPNSRALPAGHEVLWRAIEAGALRGGIGQSGVPV